MCTINSSQNVQMKLKMQFTDKVTVDVVFLKVNK